MGYMIKGLIFFSIFSVSAQNLNVRTLEEWGQNIPVWGATWSAGDNSINGYYPSFYTGFAPRSEVPDRIHVRTSRGNQTRVTVILDDQTIKDYLFDLAKRAEVYQQLSSSQNSRRPIVNTQPKGAKLIPQLQYFLDILSSPEYKVLTTVDEARSSNTYDSADFYVESLKIMEKLNPGRVFKIELDLTKEFSKWQSFIKKLVQEKSVNYLISDPQGIILAINHLVWGRINYTAKPSVEVLERLNQTVSLALNSPEKDANFIAAAYDLFLSVTGDKYNFKSVGQNGQWQTASNCTSINNCLLSYSEFTTIYPTGSAKSFTKDKFGNSIPAFATPGLWNFLDRGYHEVDNIRDEAYYGWAPKMDFEAIGNGFHNPAVRFGQGDLNKGIREKLNIASIYNQFWSVKRGGVSSGCLRLPLGHVWEMRHIFPVENTKMKQVYFFGNNPQDFDLYDIDGDGTPEIIGIQYQISYNLKGASGLSKREGADMEVSSDAKDTFYKTLYGSKNVFEITNQGYEFINPTVSFPSHLDYLKKKTSTTFTVDGTYKLYEQKYEQDKVQMYVPYTTEGLTVKGSKPLSKRIVRLMGRIRGCAPSSDKSACGEASFENELASILKEIK